MKSQTPLSDLELMRVFTDAKVRERDTAGGNGSAKILRMLSDTVRSMQNLGIDIGITAVAGAHTSAYDMVYATNGIPDKGATSVGFYGSINAGAASYLFAVATQYDDKPVERLYISKYNTGKDVPRLYSKETGNMRPKIEANVYDFAIDERALQKIQVKLASIAADNTVLLEYDTGNVFNQKSDVTPQLPKDTVAALLRPRGLQPPRS